VTLVIRPRSGRRRTSRRAISRRSCSQKFGKPFVVENRTGASGNIAVSNVVKAPADGHTILVTASTLAVSPFLSKAWTGSGQGFSGGDPLGHHYVLLVHPSQPIQSVKELVARRSRTRASSLQLARLRHAASPHHGDVQARDRTTSRT